MKTNYCEICQKERKFKRFKMPAKIEICGTSLLVDYEFDECTVCGTDYEPLENRNKNILSGYVAYREKKGYLQPEEIRAIRESYQLNIREFAAILGINYQDLARIEFGALQNSYQDLLFKWAASPERMHKWIIRKKEGLAVPLSETDEINFSPKPE